MKSRKIALAGLSVALAAALLSACAGKPAEQGVESAAPETVEAVYGKVTDATMATVTLTAEDGGTYTIAREDDTVVHSGNGISIDDYVQILYTGVLTDNSAVAKSIVVSSERDGEEKTIRGTVVDAANATIIMETEGGETVQVLKTDDTRQTVSNDIGDILEVTYEEMTDEGYLIALEIS